MPITTGTVLINRAATLLQDQSNVRWSRAELLDWLNEGQVAVVGLLPEAYAATDTVVATQGQYEFQIPSTGIRLIDVLNNTAGTKRALRKVEREVLDAQNPTWRAASSAVEATNFMFDRRYPKTFMLYPPLKSGSGVKIVISQTPGALGSEASTIILDDVFAPALANYLVYRAYLKDAEYAAGDTRAQNAYQAFLAVLTGKKAADQTSFPQ